VDVARAEGEARLEPPGRPEPIRLGAVDGEPSLRLLHARPEPDPGRGTVVILPGRGEFIEKYDETVADLLSRRFAVAVVEWRGQGLSHREGHHLARGHIADFDHYLQDLKRALGHLEQQGQGGPLIMLAHSMGGNLGLRLLHDRPRLFVAAVMTAPMFDINLKRVPPVIARGLGRAAIGLGGALWYAPGQRDFRLERCRFAGNPLTSSPARFERFRQALADRPELRLGGVTFGWLHAALRSIAITRKPGYLEAIGTPILVCQAGLERVVANRAQNEFVARLPAARLLRFDGARHEILLEADAIRNAFLEGFDRFVAETLGG
jgi:lysophospholipase